MRIVILPLSTARRMIVTQRTVPHAIRTRLDDKIATRIHVMWTSWERSSTWWKLKVTRFGNRVLANTPYEEWCLKTVPFAPAGLFPGDRRWGRKKEGQQLVENVPVVFPTGIVKESEAAGLVAAFARDKAPYHLKFMLLSLLGSPFTLPLALLPVIPNIPGMYMLYRAWSHWKAYEGCQLLIRIVKEQKFVLEPSKDLQVLYESEPPMTVALPKGASEQMVLQDSQVATVTKILDADEIGSELHKALHQVRSRIKEKAEREKAGS
ncbi:mitochondrial K+-H+ exchange-related-domain-containing protein [Lipomyces arxii]|uniref:mitochondrial K+-H+ exchange-related-domain-containing protein n=1 Tax=Lipomyces arxii TaxID=56418 RepID=UPI0034CF96E4